MEFKPHGYQAYCISRIIKVKKIGLFLDMGLGKTVTTLTAIRELKYDRFQVGSHKDLEGFSGSGKPDKTNPGIKHAGRYLYYQPGECMLAGGLLQEQLAV